MQKIKLFFGDEDFLINEELRSLKVGGDNNFESISGSEDIDLIIASLTSLPMFGGDRTVIIEDLEYEEKDEDKLFAALKDLQNGVNVIFVNYEGVDKRRKFYKLMEKIAEVREFKRFTEWEQDKALAWLMQRVKTYGKKISGAAASLLLEIVGLNLRILDKELEKVSTFIGDKSTIEEADIKCVATAGEADSFALSNALREKNVKEAIGSINRLFKDNQDPHMLLGMLAKLYRSLLQVKCLEEKRMGQYDIAKQLNAKPFFVKKCMEVTRRFSLPELCSSIKKLQTADLKMKRGASPRLTFEMLAEELCHG